MAAVRTATGSLRVIASGVLENLRAGILYSIVTVQRPKGAARRLPGGARSTRTVTESADCGPGRGLGTQAVLAA